ncbi:hypothetical protein LCGC14_1668070, partial [marine sediment metagenome]
MWTLDYSGSELTPSVTEIGSESAGDANTYYLWDIYIIGANTYVHSRVKFGINAKFEIWDVDIAPFTRKKQLLDTVPVNIRREGIIANGIHYHLAGPDSLREWHWGYQPSTSTAWEWFTGSAVDYTQPTNINARSHAWDGKDTIYAIQKQITDGLNYLVAWSLSTQVATVLDRMDVALMLDRNNNPILPHTSEKGFDLSDEKIYEVKPNSTGLTLFQDASAITDANWIAITDNFAMNTDGDMFELQDVSESEISVCDIDYLMGNVTPCEFISTNNLQNLTSIKFYDDSDVLTFFGNIVEKQYNDLNSYFYKAISYDNEINTYKFSLDETAGNRDAKVIIEEVLDSANWLHYADGSITSPTIDIKADFKNISFKDFMDEIADRCDYIWYVAPDGRVYFNDGTTASGKTVLHTSGILTNPTIKVISAQINRVKLFGGYVNGVRITSIDEDVNAQSLYGPIEYIDHFPHITNQTELDTLAGKIRARNGMNNSPFYVDVGLFDQEFIQCGNTVNFAFSPLSYAADDLIVLNYQYDAKNDQGMYKLTTGIVQNVWRGYGTVDKKTKTGDEEQLDILGGEVSGLIAGGLIDVEDDLTPQLGGDLDTAGKSINDNTGDNIVTINDALHVTGNITTDGLVDGVDIAIRDHAATVASDLNHDDIANPQGNAEEQHLTSAQVGALHAIVTFGDIDSGTDFNSHSEQIKAGFIIYGGGSITVDGSDRAGWTQRMIVIDGGYGAHFSTAGYFDIIQPTSGAITAVGGGTANTWTAAGIIIPAWQSLYYILPIGSTFTSLAANFRMVGYTSALEIPDDWIFIAGHNGDTHITKFGVGITLNNNETWINGTSSMINIDT